MGCEFFFPFILFHFFSFAFLIFVSVCVLTLNTYQKVREMPGRPRSTLLDREELISPRRMRMFFDRYYVTGRREEDEWRYWSECLLTMQTLVTGVY